MIKRCWVTRESTQQDRENKKGQIKTLLLLYATRQSHQFYNTINKMTHRTCFVLFIDKKINQSLLVKKIVQSVLFTHH